ncbi:MAG: hypothetical protein AB1578_11890 [Thermodesulfobacteriota bacterium]
MTVAARLPAPHDFLLHLRGCAPDLARRFDGIQGMERARAELRIRAPAGSWALGELELRRDELAREVERFFGPPFSAALHPGAEDPEALPLPVVSSKVWNHVAFLAWEGRRAGVLAVRKPRYRDAWVPAARAGDGPALRLLEDPEAAWVPAELPEGEGPEAALPGFLDELAALAREGGSYAHLVAAFPGDAAADRLEARLYAVKEWGTPRTPAPLLHKYTGRLHYCGPALPLLGLRLARIRLARG